MEVTSEPRAYICHLRMNKICHSGARQWWESHGFSWREFVDAGIPISKLEATGDPFAMKVVASAKGDTRRGKR